MKPGAYLLINVQSGKELDVYKALKQDNTVKNVHIVTGLHDLICYIEAEQYEDLRDEIIDSIRHVEGITRTVTCIAFNRVD